MKLFKVNLRCLYSRRRLPVYADGELPRRIADRIENHLVDCGECRAILLRLREGQRFASQVPRRSLASDQWAEIEALIAADGKGSPGPTRVRFGGWRRPAWASLATVLLALVSLSLLILILNRQSRIDYSRSSGVTGSLDLSDFHAVSISDMAQSTEPHVVAEGYVSDVRIDIEDGDLVFKLVDDVKRPQPFVVCEIIGQIKLAPPPVGSRVRVYGVSRYDGKQDHQWYEVHPVLDIEVVRR
jgi:anti-sigma factor RsiW